LSSKHVGPGRIAIQDKRAEWINKETNATIGGEETLADLQCHAMFYPVAPTRSSQRRKRPRL
jgi:hypothetical protein